MKSFYPLKRSQPTDFVEPIVRYLQQTQSQQKAHSFRQNLSKITQLRNKVTQLSYDEPSVQAVNKFIPAIEMYLRYALLLSKHLNWNKQYGVVVDDIKIVWYDSFNPAGKFMKNDIHFDIFCCFYNLGIMYFYKATQLALDQLTNSRKESMKCAKTAFYLFNRMRTYYYSGFVNTGFSDTDYAHLEVLECLSQGIIYKNMFNMFKEDQYKLGIDKIASLAGLAQKNFFRGYQIANAYFMKSSNIKAHIKTEILSLAYVESLYHDLMFNTRLAKYYQEQMDNNKDNIIYLIAYQRRALRLLDLGLKNEAVIPLLNTRPDEKKQLTMIRPQLEDSLKVNIERNAKIYKKAEIKEDQIPPPKEPPANYIVKPDEPEPLKISYEGSIAEPFSDLVDNESKGFSNDLKEFAKNRMNGLQSALTKLNKNVEVIYNENFVNYYLNLENTSKNKGIPEALKKKLEQIKMNGGKQKLELEVKILKSNSDVANQKFKEFKKSITDEESFDNSKRNQYGNQWRRQPSNGINRVYINQIEVYEKKAEVASNVNQKIIQKFGNLGNYISVVDGNQQQVMTVLPKVEVSKFIEQNKALFDTLKSGMTSVKEKMEALDVIVEEIRNFYDKTNFTEVANKYYKKVNETNREKIFEQIFSKAYKMIESFNQRSKQIEDEARKVGQASCQLNNRNKGGDEKAKKQFEIAMGKFNEINNLFRDLGQGTAFYTKLSQVLARIGETIEGFTTARKFEADDLENSLKKGGGKGNGGPNLPSMYPDQPQQNAGFYVPPPMQFSTNPNSQNNMFGTINNNNNDMNFMLDDIMRSKPSFNQNVFGGPKYESKFF